MYATLSPSGETAAAMLMFERSFLWSVSRRANCSGPFFVRMAGQ
jgi:hypothetical protein